jgi:hypothetical protein
VRGRVFLVGITAFVFVMGASVAASGRLTTTTVSGGEISAHLTKTSFKSSEAAKVKLIYKFSAPSKSFSYLLAFRKGSTWQTVTSVKKRGTFKGSKSMTVKQVFAGKSVKVGNYRLKLSVDGGSKLLTFKVIKAKSGGVTPTGSKPANTALPTISGTAKQGQRLTASKGSWKNSPSSYEYQWRRCNSSGASCANISGGTSSAYTLVYADAAHTIRAVVTATNSHGSTSVISSRTAVVTNFATDVLTALAHAANVNQAEQDMHVFFARYRMTLAITDIQPSQYATPWATWVAVGGGDLPTLKTYGRALIEEWAKYPLDWVRVTRVSGIVLVDQLAVSGTLRAAMPDVGDDVMFYDIGYGSGDYAREVIHHEFDHLLTYNLFDTYAPSDPTWLSLNPPGFRYGSGGASCYVRGSACLTGQHPVPGFVSGYATSAIEEDKAELYGYLMETHDYRLLKGWIGSDSYLAAKVANYENFLCDLSAAMCGNYFDTINGG